MRQLLDFGVENAGGAPTFTTFRRVDTLVPVTPPPIVEIGDGLYYFDSTIDGRIVYKAALNGVIQDGEIDSVVPAPATPVFSTSDRDLVNMCLAEHLSTTTQVVDLTNDQTVEAKNARVFIARARDEALAMYRWKWAERRAALAQLTGTGDWWDSVGNDWGFVYAPPADCVKPQELYSGLRNPGPQDLERFDYIANAAGTGMVIACDVAPQTVAPKSPVLFYTARIVDVTQYPAHFVALFSAWLASYLAMPVIGAESGQVAKKAALLAARLAFNDAVRLDIGSRVRDPIPPSPSLAARGYSRRVPTWRP
jgi:hypothetical protein